MSAIEILVHSINKGPASPIECLLADAMQELDERLKAVEERLEGVDEKCADNTEKLDAMEQVKSAPAADMEALVEKYFGELTKATFDINTPVMQACQRHPPRLRRRDGEVMITPLVTPANHALRLQQIDWLMTGDPAPESPQGKLLIELAEAVEAYEVEKMEKKEARKVICDHAKQCKINCAHKTPHECIIDVIDGSCTDSGACFMIHEDDGDIVTVQCVTEEKKP